MRRNADAGLEVKPLLVVPPIFLALMWTGYFGCVKAFFPPIAPGDDDGDLVLMIPFLFLALITIAVVIVWLIALALAVCSSVRARRASSSIAESRNR